MTTVSHETASHHLPPLQVARQQRQAVRYFILADAVFFGCLIFTYFYLRSLDVSGGWIPDGGQTAAAWQVWAITAVIVVSALLYRSGELAIRAGQRQRFVASTLVGLGLVLVAGALVVYQLATVPMLMSDGSYASIFITMAGIQLAHLVLLAVIALGIWNRAIQGKLDDGNNNHATLVGYFWYWVALTALLGALTTFFVS
ncbi:MAG: cytochrome c oxidase subunit 3 [Actinomycetes bacterium]